MTTEMTKAALFRLTWADQNANFEQSLKNKALAEAAPDLLAALRHAVESEIEGYAEPDEPSWLTEARAALAKAVQS